MSPASLFQAGFARPLAVIFAFPLPACRSCVAQLVFYVFKPASHGHRFGGFARAGSFFIGRWNKAARPHVVRFERADSCPPARRANLPRVRALARAGPFFFPSPHQRRAARSASARFRRPRRSWTRAKAAASTDGFGAGRRKIHHKEHEGPPRVGLGVLRDLCGEMIVRWRVRESLPRSARVRARWRRRRCARPRPGRSGA